MWYSSKQSFKQRPTSHFWQQYTEVFFFPCFVHTTHLLCGFDFSLFGGTFLRKCLSVSRGIVSSDACRPCTIRSPTAREYFVNKHSTNCILYDSCSTFLPVTYLQTKIELRTVEFNRLLKSLRYHLSILFLSTTYRCSNWSFKSTPPML